jgi:hypothetical protein
MSDIIDGGPESFSMSIGSKPSWVCPVCGDVQNEWGGFLGVTIRPYEGRYCMKCWAKWISENIPKMTKLLDADPRHETGEGQ